MWWRYTREVFSAEDGSPIGTCDATHIMPPSRLWVGCPGPRSALVRVDMCD